MRSTDGWLRRVRFRLAAISALSVALVAGLLFLSLYACELQGAAHHICATFATGADGSAFADYHVAHVGRLLFCAWLVLVACAALAGYFFAPFATRAADEAMENLSRSADAVAHDLKAPLTRLKVRCEMAVAADGPEAGFAAEVSSDVESLLAFINTLLEIARLERAGATREEPVDFARLVQDVEDLYRPLVEGAGLAFLVARPVGPLCLMANRGKMMQVVGNLVDNAFKYTPRGGRIDVSVRREGASLVLSVADTGVGVPAEALPHLFEKFYRGRNAAASGNGLGLALVQAIVQAYGGAVHVASAPGGGSVFTVRLPTAVPAASSARDDGRRVRGLLAPPRAGDLRR